MNQPTRSLSDKLLLILKGVIMGTANKVPGVSGGVVAYVAGFYEEFIYSFRRLNLKALSLLFRGRFKSFFEYINGRFLALLLFGEVLSYFTISKGLDVVLKHYPTLVWSLFFGLILGSVYFLSKEYHAWNRKNIIILIIGIMVGVASSLLDPATNNTNLWFVFFCGIVSISGMTLPGLSGSFILMLLGNYVLLLVDSINAFFDAMMMTLRWDFSWWNDPSHIELLIILIVFLLGSIIGLITLSNLLGWTFKHFKNETNALIIGFITGSLGVVWPWKETIYKTDIKGEYVRDVNLNPIIENYSRFLPEITDYGTWICIIMILLGFGLVYLINAYGQKNHSL